MTNHTDSGTPRTDAFYREHPICEHETSAHPEDCEAWLDYGRTLERENADLCEQLRAVDPDPVVCGCREASCPHTPIARLPRQELVDHFRSKIADLRQQLATERRRVVEECAKAAEDEICVCCWSDEEQAAMEHCVAAIRALTEPQQAAKSEEIGMARYKAFSGEVVDEPYVCPIHGNLGGINHCPRC